MNKCEKWMKTGLLDATPYGKRELLASLLDYQREANENEDTPSRFKRLSIPWLVRLMNNGLHVTKQQIIENGKELFDTGLTIPTSPETDLDKEANLSASMATPLLQAIENFLSNNPDRKFSNLTWKDGKIFIAYN